MGGSAKEARSDSPQSAQISGEVRTKTRRGRLPATRSIRGAKRPEQAAARNDVVFGRRCVYTYGLHAAFHPKWNARVSHAEQGREMPLG